MTVAKVRNMWVYAEFLHRLLHYMRAIDERVKHTLYVEQLESHHPRVFGQTATALPRPTTLCRREHDERGPNGVRVDVDERLSLKCLRGLSLQAKRGRLEKARQRRT